MEDNYTYLNRILEECAALSRINFELATEYEALSTRVSSGGVGSCEPKPKGIISDPTSKAALARCAILEQINKNLDRYTVLYKFIDSLLKQIPFDSAMLAELHYIRGLSYNDISSVLNLEVRTVFYRRKKLMRQLLEALDRTSLESRP